MKTLADVPLSILDLSPIRKGDSAADSFRNTLDLARHADRWGYARYWLAEHHGIPGVASAATAVVVGQVAAVTSRMRVGANVYDHAARLRSFELIGKLEDRYSK